MFGCRGTNSIGMGESGGLLLSCLKLEREPMPPRCFGAINF